MIKNAVIYCSSSDNIARCYFDEAQRLGQTLTELDMVGYTGAGNNGLMYEVERSMLQHGGKCVGVIPKFMVANGWLYEELTEIITVETIAERKEILRQRADIVLVLAGGIGTLDEMFETLALKQLGLFAPPIIIINTGGYFDDMLRMLDKIVAERFMSHTDGKIWQTINSADELPKFIKQYIDNK